jgi:predicted GTPase
MRAADEDKKVIIMGAAGRDFFNFLIYFKNNPDYKVVAFTAAQIPGIEKRSFPRSLAGRLYNNDIPIHPEHMLPGLIKKHNVDEVVFAYSDVSNRYINKKKRLVKGCGARLVILGPEATMLSSKKPVISVCAVRTGAGKSPTTRKISRILRGRGMRVVIVRHPMPYGDLEKQAVQRFKTRKDLDKNKCTIEEREEYESHIKEGVTVYAGVDYEKILRSAEKEADIIIWDGGNNDFPFYKPDLHMVIADARRPGHELTYYHGTVNVRMADAVIINKVKTAKKRDVEQIRRNIRKLNQEAVIIKANMTKSADRPELIRGKRVLVLEDGPTLTHGGLSIGAGYLAAMKYHAREIVDPRPYAVGSIKETFKKYNHLENVLPAMGYGSRQIKELEKTINNTECDSVIIGTPVDLGRYLRINKPTTNVTYDIHAIGRPTIKGVVERFVKGLKPKHSSGR